MDPNLFRYIWKHTRSHQVWILFVALISMPTYFLALDLPKRIVNGPIQGRGFEDESVRDPFLRMEFSVPEWMNTDGTLVLFEGFDLDRFQMLLGLSLTFLFLVCINGLFKFYINTFKGRLGERMLRRLRYELVDRVLRFPMVQFKRVKPSEVATMVKDEVEPLGGFIGDAFVTPVFLGGQAATAMGFILVQNVWLGGMAAGIIGIQVILIPRLRRRLIELGRERQLTTRALSGRVGEIVDAIGGVHVNDTSNFERADVSSRLGKIFAIRYEIYQRKFFVKFLNNLLAQMTPFLFYSVGGYFALTGRLDIGQLVAVIAAYKDLPSPIKELIDWDQQRLDVQVKYSQVIDQFTVDNMMESQLQPVVTDRPDRLKGQFKISNLTVNDDSGARLLERLSMELNLDRKVAVVGGLNSGAEYLCEALARLLPPGSGRITLQGEDLDELPEAITGRRIGYVPTDASLFQGSVRDNILYILKRAPLREATYDGAAAKHRAWEISEARNSGNTTLDIGADWIDYEAAGASGPEDLLDQVLRVLKIVDLDEDMLGLGLRGVIDPDNRPELAAGLLAARSALRQILEDDAYKGLVEQFDPDAYNQQATIGENLLFGTPVGEAFTDGYLSSHDYIRKILQSEGLDTDLFEMGREIADTAIELFADLPPDHPFFEQLSFMSAEQIPEYQAVLARIQHQSVVDVSDADRDMVLRLPFVYVEPRHRLGLLDESMMARIVTARQALRQKLPQELAGAIEFYDPEAYNRASSIQDNILFGRIAYGVAGGAETILKLGLDVLEKHELIDDVFDVGLDFNVGTSGKRLAQSQRQKVLMARVLLKRPDVLLINRALSSLDRAGQMAIIQRVLKDSEGTDANPPYGVVWALTNAAFASEFERVVVMKDGAMVEEGEPSELLAQKGEYAALVA